MYPCHSRDGYTVSNTDGNKNINDMSSMDTNRVLCSNNQDISSFVDTLQKDTSLYDFLNFPAHNYLNPDDIYKEEKLLFPDVFKLNKICESNLETAIINYDNTKLSTSCSTKRPLIENETHTALPEPKRINFEQNIGSCSIGNYSYYDKSFDYEKQLPTVVESSSTALMTKDTDNPQSTYAKEGNHPSSIKITNELSQNKQYVDTKTPRENSIKKELYLETCRMSNFCYEEITMSIYIHAINKINIDSSGLFKNIVLKELDGIIKSRGFSKSSINLSVTYSNIRNYIMDRVCPFLNDPTTSDILITPGMSISNLRSSCLLNHLFFEKLHENCIKIAKNIFLISDNSLSYLFQKYINFNLSSCLNSAVNDGNIIYTQQNKFTSALKYLIAEIIYNLPNSIIFEIKKFDDDEIVKCLFFKMHDVFISRSFMRKLGSLSESYKSNLPNSRLSANSRLFNNFLEEVENLIITSCILFRKETFLPSKTMIRRLSEYLLSDIRNEHDGFGKNTKLATENASVDVANAFSSTTVDIKIEDYNCEPIATTSDINGTKQLKRCTVLKKLYLVPYHHHNLHSAEFTSSIYEYAIHTIDIDSDEFFSRTIAEKLYDHINRRGLDKLSMSIELTYSNVRRYILGKVSPHINNIITNADVIITPHMSISDIKHKCMSNIIFFEKLSEKCEKIVEEINIIPDLYFSNIIQSCINFGHHERLNINHKKNKFCSEVKLLIMKTIFSLQDKIVNEINKFNQDKMVRNLFSSIHGIFISKSLIRNLNLFFNSNKLPTNSFKDNINLLNDLLASLINMVKTSPIFHEGKLFFPNKHTSEKLSKYLLADMYAIPAKFHKKLKVSRKNISNPRTLISSVDLDGTHINNMIYTSKIIRSKLLSTEESISYHKINSKWNPTFIASLNIYKLAISMIDIDEGEFKNSFIDKNKHISSVKNHFNKKGKIDVDLSETYNRVKIYITDLFCNFLNEVEEETKPKIVIYDGMTLDEFEYSYISNDNFFDKFRKFCSKMVEHIKKCTDSTLINLVQNVVYLKTEKEMPRRILIRRSGKVKFHKDVAKILIRNISTAPGVITNLIKLLPRNKIIGEYMSPFHEIYIDNTWLLKAKSLFEFTQKKVSDDPLLSWLIDKMSLDMADRVSRKNNDAKQSRQQSKLADSHIACRVRKLVREELNAFNDKLDDPIMIMNHNKIETADQKIRSKILDNLESDLISAAIKLCRDLRLKTYESRVVT
ncbi:MULTISPECIES: hypothetical protein [Candidatus Ichthyocystis]|uniref:Uncharacterized protein n=1 Tax=Candidatus Ichthyocystis hellenicum TaxID=1561003 RepID=A0A0S4M3B9_9BURK|nr:MULTISPECIES: hypothetical protein [Ichthyocystis]CUT18265.1 hypothetical protein Ark11_1467 [Candidatus Ichthyocystis hellenicum]